MKRPDLGDLKIDNLWPLLLGLLIGVWRVTDGGEWWMKSRNNDRV